MSQTRVDTWVLWGPIVVCFGICAIPAGLALLVGDRSALWLSAFGLIVSAPVSVIKAKSDVQRIQQYLSDSNHNLLEIYWEPFAPGWQANKLLGAYEVLYINREKQLFSAICRTGWLDGVYFTQEQLLAHPKQEFYFHGKWNKIEDN